MARKRRPRHLRPKAPARIRKTKRARRAARGRQHPELAGLGLLTLGLFLAVVLWLEWDGGIVGEKVDTGLDTLVGGARLALPLFLALVGGLLVARTELVDMRPFRTGLLTLGVGVMTVLGEERGGAIGRGLDTILSRLLGETGTTILGLFLVVAGGILVTGASLGVLLRHSARAARRTAQVARRSVERVRVAPDPPVEHPRTPPIDGEEEYPDVVSDAPPAPIVLIDQLQEPELPSVETPTLFDPPTSEHADYRLPDPNVLRRSKPAAGNPAKAIERTGEALLQGLANFGVDAHLIGQVVGPRVTRYELQLAPGTKVGKVAALKDDLAYALATTEIRILAPIPGKQAVGVE
ncbi:MAG: DNA translocase FtsK, partial [Gaiellaceae bacterium]